MATDAIRPREAVPARAFVALADTFVVDFDLRDLLRTLVETCADVLDTTAAGLLPGTGTGEPQVVGSAAEDAHPLEVALLGAASGPCWECVRTGRPIRIADIDAVGDRWPELRDAAPQHGFRSLHSTPIRLGPEVVGALNLFDTELGVPTEPDPVAFEILVTDDPRALDLVAAQLEHVLSSRIAVEQAKGVLAASTGMTIPDASTALHAFARDNHLNLRAVAVSLVNRRIDGTVLTGGLMQGRGLLVPAARAATGG